MQLYAKPINTHVKQENIIFNVRVNNFVLFESDELWNDVWVNQQKHGRWKRFSVKQLNGIHVSRPAVTWSEICVFFSFFLYLHRTPNANLIFLHSFSFIRFYLKEKKNAHIDDSDLLKEKKAKFTLRDGAFRQMNTYPSLETIHKKLCKTIQL